MVVATTLRIAPQLQGSPMPPVSRRSTLVLAGGLAAPALANAQPAPSLTLNLACMNDPFATVLTRLAPRYQERTGIRVNVDILSYPELLSRITADFVGRTRNYDLCTMDIVWAGQFAEAGHSMELSSWIQRDRAEIGLDDIYEAALLGIGNFRGRQIAYPFAAYVNVLAFRRDLYERAGLRPPETMAELIANAERLTDAPNNLFGWAANGRRGPPVAQDWMTYNAQIGGSILGPDNRPAIASAANVRSLTVYRDLFRRAAPPGAVNYDWAARHEAYRQGLVAQHQIWSISIPSYENPEISRVVGRTSIMLAPTAEGMPKRYGIGGWGLAINNAIEDRRKEAGWGFIKWATSAETQRAFLDAGVGVFTRKSVLNAPDLRQRFPFFAVADQSLANGDADFRPRIPQYPQIQDLLGTAVNAVLVGTADPQRSLEDAQGRALRLF
jgi:multiple sugar transport system substrate-binding protein